MQHPNAKQWQHSFSVPSKISNSHGTESVVTQNDCLEEELCSALSWWNRGSNGNIWK